MQLSVFSLISVCLVVCCGSIGLIDGPSNEVAIQHLERLVHTEQGKQRLQSEYESIEKGKRKPWTVAETPENLPKNRYDDLLAFDDTRVHLEPREHDESDYINANWINGYHGEKEYVATQGPLANTSKDFWAMIWQLDVRKIVMLANLVEHGKPKVAKYWTKRTGIFGDMIVTKLSEKVNTHLHHTVRTFSIRKVGALVPRIVRHFHFTGWPDLGVPDNRLSVVSLMQQARKYRSDIKSPIVVHCSAGVGRTGTIILTDSMIERAKVERTVDFPKRLNEMRLQRIDVVETKDQYIFAHEAVHDFFFGAGTPEYLKKVEHFHENADHSSVRSEFQPPKSLKDSVRQIKWLNQRLALDVEVAEKILAEVH